MTVLAQHKLDSPLHASTQVCLINSFFSLTSEILSSNLFLGVYFYTNVHPVLKLEDYCEKATQIRGLLLKWLL